MATDPQDVLNNELLVAAVAFNLDEVAKLVRAGAREEDAFLSDQKQTLNADSPDYNAQIFAHLADQGHAAENENQALFALYETLLLAGHPVPDGSKRMCLARVIAGCDDDQVARAERLLSLCMAQDMFDWRNSQWACEIGTKPMMAPLQRPMSLLLDAAGRAAEAGHLSLVRLLVEGSGTLDNESLQQRFCNQAESYLRPLPVRAAAGGRLDCVDYVLGLMPEALWSGEGRLRGRTITAAAANGHIETVRHLVQAWGCDINDCQDQKSNPMVAALQNQRPDMVPLLLAMGADPNVGQSLEGAGPAHLALARGYRDAFEQLLEAGLDVVTPGDRGRRLIVMAGTFGDDWALAALVAKGAGINDADAQGRTALSWAAMNDRKACIDWLLEAGADLEQADHEGRTPLSWATERDMVEAYERLIAAGANPDAVDRDGQTPESRAMAQGGRIAAAIAQKQHEAGTPLAPGAVRRSLRI